MTCVMRSGKRAGELVVQVEAGFLPTLAFLAIEMHDNVWRVDLRELIGVIVVVLTEAGAHEAQFAAQAHRQPRKRQVRLLKLHFGVELAFLLPVLKFDFYQALSADDGFQNREGVHRGPEARVRPHGD